jgi:hypothetical protein
MTAAPFQIVAGTTRFPATDPVAARRFADAYEAATRTVATVATTPNLCAHCEEPLERYPCRSAKCEDARSAYDKRVERMCDDL